MDRKVKIEITRHPTRDEYQVTLSLTIDGLELHLAKDREDLMKSLITDTLINEIARQIMGRVALQKLVPKDRYGILRHQYIDKCFKNRRFPTQQGLDEYLQKNGYLT